MNIQRPNKSVETNRRPGSPFDAVLRFGSAPCAPPSLSAAVAHLCRSASLGRVWDSRVAAELPCRPSAAQHVLARADLEAFDTFECEATGRERLLVGAGLLTRRRGRCGDARTSRFSELAGAAQFGGPFRFRANEFFAASP